MICSAGYPVVILVEFRSNKTNPSAGSKCNNNMAASDQNILLYGNLDVDGRPNVVLLTAFGLYWDATSKASTPESPSIEIISCKSFKKIYIYLFIVVRREHLQIFFFFFFF